MKTSITIAVALAAAITGAASVALATVHQGSDDVSLACHLGLKRGVECMPQPIYPEDPRFCQGVAETTIAQMIAMGRIPSAMLDDEPVARRFLMRLRDNFADSCRHQLTQGMR